MPNPGPRSSPLPSLSSPPLSFSSTRTAPWRPASQLRRTDRIRRRRGRRVEVRRSFPLPPPPLPLPFLGHRAHGGREIVMKAWGCATMALGVFFFPFPSFSSFFSPTALPAERHRRGGKHPFLSFPFFAVQCGPAWTILDIAPETVPLFPFFPSFPLLPFFLFRPHPAPLRRRLRSTTAGPGRDGEAMESPRLSSSSFFPFSFSGDARAKGKRSGLSEDGARRIPPGVSRPPLGPPLFSPPSSSFPFPITDCQANEGAGGLAKELAGFLAGWPACSLPPLSFFFPPGDRGKHRGRIRAFHSLRPAQTGLDHLTAASSLSLLPFLFPFFSSRSSPEKCSRVGNTWPPRRSPSPLSFFYYPTKGLGEETRGREGRLGGRAWWAGWAGRPSSFPLPPFFFFFFFFSRGWTRYPGEEVRPEAAALVRPLSAPFPPLPSFSLFFLQRPPRRRWTGRVNGPSQRRSVPPTTITLSSPLLFLLWEHFTQVQPGAVALGRSRPFGLPLLSSPSFLREASRAFAVDRQDTGVEGIEAGRRSGAVY